MSSCKLDHTNEDVQKKLFEQKLFLPELLYIKCLSFLAKTPTQLQLNELFHLLKKYDLVTDGEKQIRNQQINELV